MLLILHVIVLQNFTELQSEILVVPYYVPYHAGNPCAPPPGARRRKAAMVSGWGSGGKAFEKGERGAVSTSKVNKTNTPLFQQRLAAHR